MNSRPLVVPVRLIGKHKDQPLVLDYDSALALRTTLDEVIAAHELQPELPSKPTLIYGWLSKESMLDFFAQAYKDRRLLDVRAGRLYGRILDGIARGRLQVAAFCLTCDQRVPAKPNPGFGQSRHTFGDYKRHTMALSAVELKALSADAFTAGTSTTGDAALADLQLLQSYL